MLAEVCSHSRQRRVTCCACGGQVDNPDLQGAVTTAVQRMGGPGEASDSIDSLTSLVFHEHVIGPQAQPLPESEEEACQPGLLTDTGVQQHEALGRFFRQTCVLPRCRPSPPIGVARVLACGLPSGNPPPPPPRSHRR